MARSALVTGGTGFIATHLVPALVEAEWDVRVTARRSRPEWLPDEADYCSADLASGEGVEDLVDGVTHVFHLAGASSSKADEEEMHRSNVGGTENLLAASDDRGLKRFIYYSSTSVYGEEVQLRIPVSETEKPHPSRGYGKAKWEAEQAVWRHGDKGMAVTVLRPVSTYGPGNTKLLGSAILDVAIEAFAGEDTLMLYEQPTEQRLVHVDDVVAASLHLADNDEAAGRAFNVVLDQYPTSHEIAGILARHFGMELALDDDPDCGPSYERRKETRERMLAQGMKDAILFTEERFRFMRKQNRNNRLSIDALLDTGFQFKETDLAGSIARTIGWYRDERWVL